MAYFNAGTTGTTGTKGFPFLSLTQKDFKMTNPSGIQNKVFHRAYESLGLNPEKPLFTFNNEPELPSTATKEFNG